MSGPKYLRSMKKGVNWIENQGENWYKMDKNLNNTFLVIIRTIFGPIISGTKYDRDKLISSDHDEA